MMIEIEFVREVELEEQGEVVYIQPEENGKDGEVNVAKEWHDGWLLVRVK